MAERIPLVLIGSPPQYGGLTQLKAADTLAGVVNHADFAADQVAASAGAGVFSPVTLTDDTVLANTGSGIEALSFSGLSTQLLQSLELSDFLTLLNTGPNAGDFIVWNSIDSVWENREGSLGLLSDVDLTTNPPTFGQRLVFDGTSWVPQDDAPTDGLIYGRRDGDWAPVAAVPVGVSITLNSVLPGIKAYWVSTVDWQINGWYIVGESTGSVVVDIWKNTTVPTVIDSITGTEKPTLANSQLAADTALTTWTNTQVNIGDILAFSIESTDAASNYVTLSLTGVRT